MKEAYRDKRGRFSTYWKLWQGPRLPKDHPLAVERQRLAWEARRKAMVDAVCAPNPLLEYLRERGRIK